MNVVVVTGTGTEVGKTVTTAALAAAAPDARGCSVRVVKPVQTGLRPGEPGDADEVAVLSGCSAVHELVRLADPLAPATAAWLRGVEIPSVAELARDVLALAAEEELLLVEGAGGVLVRLDSDGGTIADLAMTLRSYGCAVDVVVVTSAELGTLNATELTIEALAARGCAPLGLVIGSWPAQPELIHRCNRNDLPALTGMPLLGAIPAGAGSLRHADFQSAAQNWFDGQLWDRLSIPGPQDRQQDRL